MKIIYLYFVIKDFLKDSYTMNLSFLFPYFQVSGC